METLGDKIKHLRSKLTQEELAALLQVDRSTLASWEINRREPDIETLCRLANFFHVTVDWLVGYEPTKKSSLPPVALVHEAANHYQANDSEAWQKIIAKAQNYGLTPDQVYQLLELNAQIALALKDQK
jgi:transcriptional regulator with XRE-family HTH domain